MPFDWLQQGGSDTSEKYPAPMTAAPFQQTISYDDAMRAAAMGRLDDTVIDAIRREHAAVERSGPLSRRVIVKNNLASALLNMANAAANPAEYVRMYLESEELLVEALALQPLNSDAEENLATVRKNLKMRPGVRGGTVINDFDKNLDSYRDGGRKDDVGDEEYQVCISM